MRYIKKSGTEPEDLQKYKRDCRRASPPLKITYKDMPKDGSRKQLAVDQGYICAYCMRRVCLDSENKEQYINIEHIVPQNQLTDEEATNFSNFIGVCSAELRKAHQANDRAVMDAYGFVKGSPARTSESACVAELMKMYQTLTSK